jgi:hypothetical protein
MEDKLKFIFIGYTLTISNLLLIGTRLNALGIVFGLTGALFFIKAILIRK